MNKHMSIGMKFNLKHLGHSGSKTAGNAKVSKLWDLGRIWQKASRWLADARASKSLLLHTPLFDVIKGQKTETGLEPVRVDSPNLVCIVVKRDNELLVEKQFRHGISCDAEEFLYGIVEKLENPIYAAKRELCKKAGIRLTKGVSDLAYLGKCAANPAFMSNFMHYFYVNLDIAEWVQEDQHLDEHEKLKLLWKPTKEVLKNRPAWLDGSSAFFAGAVLKMIQKGLVSCDEIL